MDRDAVPPSRVATGADPPPPAAEATATATDRRVLLVLCLAMFLAVVNFLAISPFFPEVARDLGTTVPLLGQVATVLPLLSALLGLGVGPLADRYGHRRLLVGGMLAVAANLIGTALAPSYDVLLALAALGGLGDAILFGLPLAVAGTRFAGEARRRALAWTASAISVGSVAGVPLLAAFGGTVGWRPAVAGAGVATLAAARLAAVWLPADPPTHPDPPGARALLAAYRPLLRHRPLLGLYAAGGLRAAAWVGPLAYVGAFLADERGFGANGVAVAYAVVGGGVLLGNLATTRLGLVPWRPLVAVATATQGALLAVFFALPLDPAFTLAALALAAFAGALAFIGLTTLLVDETPGGVATTMVLNGSVFNLGTALGVAAGGLVIALQGYVAFGIGLPILALAAAAFVGPTHARTSDEWGETGPRQDR